MTRNGISTIHRAKKMEQFSKGEECFSDFQEKEKIRRIAFFLSFSFLFSIYGRIMRNPYTKNETIVCWRKILVERYRKLLEILVRYDDVRARKKRNQKKILEKHERKRERKDEGKEKRKNWREKKLNVSPSAYKHDRSSGFSVSVLIPAWHTPYGIVFISGRPFCVLLRPFVNGRNRPVLHFTCRVCHAALLDRKERPSEVGNSRPGKL